MKNIIKISFYFTFLFLLSCYPKNQISGYYSFETECIGVELDGSQTLKAWGRGKNKKDAVEQAKKNAVRDVLFKGIRKGRSECELRPLLVEVNANEKYQKYFNAFFADGGHYVNFISNKDRSPKGRHVAGSEVVYGVTVRVLRSELKKQLLKDEILK